VAPRARKAIEEYDTDGVARANNVTQLVGSTAQRMQVENYRMIFYETSTEITAVKFAPVRMPIIEGGPPWPLKS
jgi:hypothetical protein